MPELPEVESIIRTLRNSSPALIGRHIKAVDVLWSGAVSGCYSSDLQAALEGSVFVSLGRHGKFLILELEAKNRSGKQFLIIHLRMTGRLSLVPLNQAVDRHTRLVFLLDRGLALRFDDPRKFGRLWLVNDPAEVTASLGPDALSVSYNEFAERFAAHRRQLKPLLLDQSFLAGIGNIYADESLFRSKLHPLTISSDLSPDEVRRLHCVIIAVLEEAVAVNGANIDGVFKAGEFVVNVYGREGYPCPVCRSPVVKIRVAQRGTHICPQCQSMPEKL